jgi:hypothetical protein
MKTFMNSICLLLIAAGAFAQPSGLEEQRGEQVGWARLKTSGNEWRRHATGDPVLMRFLRTKTSLNIDPTWYVADVENPDEMCKYPLLFAQSIQMVGDERGRANLAEYIRRGGFLLIDACINKHITPNPNLFFKEQSKILQEILPEARIVALPNDHPIYRSFFRFPNGAPHTEDAPAWSQLGFYGIEIGSRMAGIISFSGLQCGWDGMKRQTPGHDVVCMRMLTNIYIYAMLQGDEGSTPVNKGLSTPSAP